MEKEEKHLRAERWCATVPYVLGSRAPVGPVWALESEGGRQQGPMHAGGPKHACMHVGAPASGCMCRPVVPSCPKPPTPTSCKTTATAGTTSNRYLVSNTHTYMAKSLISNHAYIPPFYISLHAPSIALDYTTIIETNHVRRDDILLLN